MSATPLDKLEGWIWLNGEMVPWQEAKIHVLSHGIHYGSSCFEGIRAYNGKAFKLHEHNVRLIDSAKLIDMTVKYTADELDKATNDVLAKNNFTNAYIRPMVWRGSEALGIGVPNSSVNVMIAAWVWDSYFGADGISLMTSKWRKTGPDMAPIQSKTAGLYTVGTLAKHEAMKEGFSDALMWDFEGNIAECTVANIFFIKDGALHTPIPDRFLNGITRQTVVDIARRNGLSVTERRIKPEEVAGFDEVFITGTAAEIVPVNKIDATHFAIGPVTRKLQDLYKIETGQKAA